MPRADLLTTNFTGGELSPRLYGRPDLQKYADSAKELRDVVVYQHGGVTSRPGTAYLGEVKDSADTARLIPFVRDTANAYVLEFGDQVMRVWKNGALVESSPSVPLEVVLPYTAAQIWDVDFTHGEDTMILAHSAHALRRLRRFSDTRWVLDSAPLDPVPFDEIGARYGVIVTLSAVSGTPTATGASPVWLQADVGRTISYLGASALITGYTSTTVVNTQVTSDDFTTVTLPANGWVLEGSPQTTCTPSAKEPVGATITLTLGANGWRSDDVGKFVQINGGLCKITAYTSATIVNAEIITVLSGTTAADADAWTLEGAVWNQYDGYPQSVTFHEQRLVAGATTKYPQTIWGSRSGLYFDFTKGTADDMAYSFRLVTDEINPIMYLVSARDLLALTYGGEWTISGGIEKPITPTSVRAKMQNRGGSSTVRPEQVGDDVFYAQRGGTVLRSLGYRVELAGYASDEASTFSEHIVALGIVEMSYQQAPERILWIALGDGRYASCTISREQQLRAFTLCTPGGSGEVKSICSIPEGDADSTYMIVEREVDGATVQYVERMVWTAPLDCQVSSSPASATISGLDHLEGLAVGCLADSVDLGNFTVSSGSITLPRVAAQATVGLRKAPRVKLLSPEIGTGQGANLGLAVSAGQTRVLFRDTVGCSVNGQPVAFRSLGPAILDEPIPEFTGWKDISNIGWSKDSGEIELAQPQAYPWTILAVVRRMTANSG